MRKRVLSREGKITTQDAVARETYGASAVLPESRSNVSCRAHARAESI